jgi:hypothetical protein
MHISSLPLSMYATKNRGLIPDQMTLILSSIAALNVLAAIHPRSATVTILISSSGGLH